MRAWTSVSLRRSSAFLALLASVSAFAAPPQAYAQPAASPAPAGKASDSASAARRFEEALPGFSIARVLWREGKLVLEHEGRFVVLRPGDRLPGRPLVELLEVGDGGAMLRDAAIARGGEAGAPVALPERLIKLARTPEGEGFSVVVLMASEPSSPLPLVEEPPAAHPMGPDGGAGPVDGKHQAPLVPATRQGGGGGR